MSKFFLFLSKEVPIYESSGESAVRGGWIRGVRGLLGFITSHFVKLVTHSFHVVIVMNRLLSSSFFITGFP